MVLFGHQYTTRIRYDVSCTTDDPSLLIDVDIPDGPATTTSAPAPPVPAGVSSTGGYYILL